MTEYDYSCVQYPRIEVETIYQIFLWSAVGRVSVLSFCPLLMSSCVYVLLAILSYIPSLSEIRHVGPNNLDQLKLSSGLVLHHHIREQDGH
jgi:hypothetical protein